MIGTLRYPILININICITECISDPEQQEFVGGEKKGLFENNLFNCRKMCVRRIRKFDTKRGHGKFVVFSVTKLEM